MHQLFAASAARAALNPVITLLQTQPFTPVILDTEQFKVITNATVQLFKNELSQKNAKDEARALVDQFDVIVADDEDRYIEVSLQGMVSVVRYGLKYMEDAMRAEMGSAFDTEGRPVYVEHAIQLIDDLTGKIGNVAENDKEVQDGIPSMKFRPSKLSADARRKFQAKVDEQAVPVLAWLAELKATLQAAL